MAVIAGLEALNRPCDVKVYSDSKYVVDAFNQNWIGNWVKKGWKRGKNEPVKNVDSDAHDLLPIRSGFWKLKKPVTCPISPPHMHGKCICRLRIPHKIVKSPEKHLFLPRIKRNERSVDLLSS